MQLHKAILLLVLSFSFLSEADAQTTYHINPKDIAHQIDVNVYGQFLEHIYNSANNGLWGDLVWNRSIEMVNTSEGEWAVENGEIIQSSLNTDIRLLFGDTSWQDYELSLDARKLGGAEGFLIIFRAEGDNFYWLNLGGWGNDQHGIERGSAQGKSILGNAIGGSVITDQWYNIKIRCEGNHFLALLDGDTLFDVTDNNAHLVGQVGVGTWSTSAAYKNIRVTEIPSGNVLYDSIPDLGKPGPVSIPYWQSVNGAVLYPGTDRLNSQRSVLVENPKGNEAGIQQSRFNIQIQHYSGSFWAKSEAGTSLTVNLLNGTDTLDQGHFISTTADWEEFLFEFDPKTATTEGVLQIVFPGPDTVLIDQVSMLGQDAEDHEGFRPDLLEAVNGLQPPIIRWPGGCYVSAYFWKDGIGEQKDRGAYTINLWDDMDVNSLGTDEYMKLCELTGAAPLICVNSGILDATCGVPIVKKLTPEEYLQDALDWMEYCNGNTTTTWGAVRAANGHPEPYHVKYWEIDNEVWAAGIEAYVEVVKKFAPAMRAKYPDIKIIACGSGGYNYNWNQVLIDECADLIDYVSTHHYEGNDNFASGVTSYENFIEDFAERVAASSNPDLKMYMSEWGVWGPIDWRSGLHTGGLLNAFERQGEVFTLAGPALFLRHEDACCWNNSFINFNNSDWFPAPNYVVMKLWREHYAPNFISLGESNPELNAVATLSADSTIMYFKLVNPTPDPESIILNIDSAFEMEGANMKQVQSSNLYAANSMQNPDNIKVQGVLPAITEQEVSFEAPAYAAVVVTVYIKEKQTGQQQEVLRVPHRSHMLVNAPNPFSDQVSIRFMLAQSGKTSLRVYDNSGKLVRELVNDEFVMGSYSLIWNGDNTNGSPVKNGIYLVELVIPEGKFVERVILNK